MSISATITRLYTLADTVIESAMLCTDIQKQIVRGKVTDNTKNAKKRE